MAITIDATKVRRKLKQLDITIPIAAAAALTAEAMAIQNVSMKRTPVDVRKGTAGGGTLRGSHEVSTPFWSGTDVEVVIAVGAGAESYAVIQHENMAYRHAVGQAKFLESAVHEAAESMAQNLAKYIKGAL